MTWQALMKEELERLRQADIPEADSDIRLLAMDVAGRASIFLEHKNLWDTSLPQQRRF